MAQVLVTGGNGFVGRPLVRALRGRGDTVWVLDNLSTSRYVPPAFGGIEGDVLDYRAVKRAVKGVDLVINLASVVGQVRAHANPELAYDTSVIGVEHLLRATDAPIMHFSSSAVYGTQFLGLAREDAQVHEDGLYGYDGNQLGYAWGKRDSEKALLAQDWTRRLIIRPFNVVGPGQVGDYGMVLPRFIGYSQLGRPIEVYGDGRQTRSFSYIDTFIEVILKLIDEPKAWQLEVPIVNVGAPTSTSIHQLAIEVQKAVHGRPSAEADIKFVPYDTIFPGCEDVRERTPDTTLLESLIGPVAWPSIEEIVRRTVEAS